MIIINAKLKKFNDKKDYLFFVYCLVIVLAAISSIILMIISIFYKVNILKVPYVFFNIGSLTIFTLDYFIRFFISKRKLVFFKRNIFELLAIIPFHSLFSFFRIFRVFQIGNIFLATRISQMFNFTQILMKHKRSIKHFVNFTGIIYIFSISIISLVISALIFSLAEGYSYGNSFWWAVVTATTVGYGGIIPHTLLGRITAGILMVFGIGFIGTLTSSICSFFIDKHTKGKKKLLIKI